MSPTSRCLQPLPGFGDGFPADAGDRGGGSSSLKPDPKISENLRVNRGPLPRLRLKNRQVFRRLLRLRRRDRRGLAQERDRANPLRRAGPPPGASRAQPPPPATPPDRPAARRTAADRPVLYYRGAGRRPAET